MRKSAVLIEKTPSGAEHAISLPPAQRGGVILRRDGTRLHMALLRALKKAAPDKHKAFVTSLSAEQKAAFLRNWWFMARPEQLLPAGKDWAFWLYLAGRGAGKTRTGAETSRELVRRGYMRLGLIAPTASDVRDVMVEGESGVLAVCHAEDRDYKGNPMGKPAYEPSKRRLTWANGAVATLYSADEPERLRGPQHEFLWCFVAGTRVAMPGGERPIETLEEGDVVLTREGPCRVMANGTRRADVGRVAFDNGAELVGTADHPVYTSSGWMNLADLSKGDEVCVLDACSGTGGASVASTWQPVGRQDVYCLKVEGQPEYFANGVLVHNCDELCAWRYPEAWDLAMFGLRLGKHPRAFISTTPKPKRLIVDLMKDETCVVTRGTTFDNRANLAHQFFKQVVAKYEGTRLGKQELEGLVLEEAEGALWNRETLDATRRRDMPDGDFWFKRIVVAVDPATTNKESSDETGIVVCGLGSDDHGYILFDASGRYTPAGWAKRVHELYGTWQADVVVAEGNQGGEMVKHTIHSANKNINVQIVHASRGKAARAEPIAALFEQGRCHIVGTAPTLEDQLCVWEPLSGEGSPDRLDAMVWGLTSCMLTRGETGTGQLEGFY